MLKHSHQFLSRGFSTLLMLALVASPGMAEDRQAYETKAQTRVQDLQTQIDGLRTEVEESPDDQNALIAKLQTLKEEVTTRFKNMQAASADQWQQFSVSLEEKVSNAENAYTIAKRDFYAWKTQSRFDAVTQKQEALALQVREVKGEIKKEWAGFNAELHNIKEQIAEMKSSPSDKWEEIHVAINTKLKDVDESLQNLDYKINLAFAQRKLADHQEKLAKLENKFQSEAEPISEETKLSFDNFKEKVRIASEKIDMLSAADQDTWQKSKEELNITLTSMEKAYTQLSVFPQK